jgi:hypothetical protein
MSFMICVYHEGEQIKEDEMSGECDVHRGRRENARRVLMGNREGKRSRGRLGR